MKCDVCGSPYHEVTTAGCPHYIQDQQALGVRPTAEKRTIDVLNEILFELRAMKQMMKTAETSQIIRDNTPRGAGHG